MVAFSGRKQPESFADAVRGQLEKIVASELFTRSPNSIQFLRFIVNETLEGRADELKESVIGIEVFKIKDFDSRVHTSVRKEATRLRERLEEYYNQVGSRDAVRIEVPKGRYKPEFGQKSGGRTPGWLVRAAAIVLIVVVPLAAYPLLRWTREYFAQRKPGLPQQKHIVVLPFTSVDANPGSYELRLGLLFTLTTKLSQIERFQNSFWVIPASEVLASRVDNANKACGTFGTNLVVTGSVERSGGKTRLTANLIHCLGGQQRHLNSRMVDSQLGDAFVLQDEVIRNVVEMLELKLGGEASRAILSGGTTEPHAEDFYLQARGYLLRGTDSVDHAIDLFRQALQQDPMYALAHAGLGEAYLQKYDLARDPGWIGMARASCEQAIRINSQLAPVYVTQGLIHAATGHYIEAIQEYGKALDIDPQSTDAYRHLASAYDKLERTEEAEDTYHTAIQHRRDYWGAYKDLGVFYYRRGRYMEAEKAFISAKELAPDNFEVYFDLGGIYLQLGRYPEAETMLQRSLARKPNAVAYNNLSAVYFYQRHYAEAVPPMKKAVELEPANVAMWGSLGRTYRFAGSAQESSAATGEAIRLAQQQLETNPQDSELRADLALFLAEARNRVQAMSEMRKARAGAPANVNVLFRAVLAYEIVGDRAAALNALGAIVRNGQLMEEIRRRPELDALRRDFGYSNLVQGTSPETVITRPKGG